MQKEKIQKCSLHPTLTRGCKNCLRFFIEIFQYFSTTGISRKQKTENKKQTQTPSQ